MPLFAFVELAFVKPAFVERVAMRNALGLMLASVVAAVMIAGVWYWTSAPRASLGRELGRIGEWRPTRRHTSGRQGL